MQTLRHLRSNVARERTSILSLQALLQRFADADVADDVFALAMKPVQRGFGFFYRAVFQLGKFEAAFAIEFVLDDVFGRLGHGHTCQSVY
jgi:hypothetical protein